MGWSSPQARQLLQPAPGRQEAPWLKRAIWLYLLLLILEGALRKWLFPSLSAPLLIVRDPVALLIILLGMGYRRIPSNILMLAYWVVLVVWSGIGMFQVLHDSLGNRALAGMLIVAYGLRTNLLHIPVIFIIGQTLDESDVEKVGKFMLYLALPMAALMALQYKSPAHSWINAGTAGDKIGQIASSGGHIRPAGLFTYITGAAHYWELVTVFLIYALSRRRVYSSWLGWVAAGSLLVAAVVSGSRTLVLSCGLVVLFAMILGLLQLRLMARAFRAGVPLLLFLLLLSQFPVVQEGAATSAARWNEANAASGGGVENGVGMRALGYFTKAWPALVETPLHGYGIGLGTNVGVVLAVGKRGFVLGEEEWVRVIQEAGAIGGVLFIGFRLLMAFKIAGAGLRTALLHGRSLAWLMAGAAFHSVINEPLSQPTNLGFMVLTGGMCIAATRAPAPVLPEILESEPASAATMPVEPRTAPAKGASW